MVQDLSFDFGDVGGLIATGNITFDALPTTTLSGPIRLPPTAKQEYSPGYTGWPGHPGTATTWSPLSLPQIRGFIWAKENLIVSKPGWVVSGAIAVGTMEVENPTGRLWVQAGADLTLYYDDIINHNIRMNPVVGTTIELQPDTLRDVSIR
jgi:hypothetical protein